MCHSFKNCAKLPKLYAFLLAQLGKFVHPTQIRRRGFIHSNREQRFLHTLLPWDNLNGQLEPHKPPKNLNGQLKPRRLPRELPPASHTLHERLPGASGHPLAVHTVPACPVVKINRRRQQQPTGRRQVPGITSRSVIERDQCRKQPISRPATLIINYYSRRRQPPQ